jgi:LAO/AO transport system kinase
LISQVEAGGEAARDVLRALHPHTGQAHVVGITGAPGAGKSTLILGLTRHLREMDRTVAVVAVDPSSAFTGGALLGDRVRMTALAGDPGVYVRSMATRGQVGGVSRATADVVRVFDGVGYDVVLVETVGAGQLETAVARLVHTTVVVETPGMGDDVQALKAGLLEIADILVVNKSDRPGARQTARMLAAEVEGTTREWRVPVLPVTAVEATGIDAVCTCLGQHRAYLERSGLWVERERGRAKAEFLDALSQALLSRFLTRAGCAQVAGWVERIASREVDVHTLVESLCERGV